MNLNSKLKRIMNSEVMKKYNYPTSISEIDDLPFNTHAGMVQEIKSGNAFITQGFGDISSSVYFLIANSYEKISQYIYTSLPYIMAIAFLMSSLILPNYFFLIGIIFPFIAGTFTSNFFQFKKIIPIVVFTILVISYFMNFPTISILSIGYLINHFLLLQQRRMYMKVLYNRSLELESAFIFLFVSKKINLLDKYFKPYI